MNAPISKRRFPVTEYSHPEVDQSSLFHQWSQKGETDQGQSVHDRNDRKLPQLKYDKKFGRAVDTRVPERPSRLTAI